MDENENVQDDAVYLVTWNGETYRIRKRFKVIQFMRLITTDPVEALSMVFHDESEFEELADQDFSMEEFETLLETILEQVGKRSAGKSSGRPGSSRNTKRR